MSELVATLLKWAATILAVAGVFGIGYEVLGASNGSNHAADVGTLANKIQAVYQGQPSFSSVSTAICYKQAPKRMKSATAGQLQNPWGGAVTCAPNANPVNFDLSTVGVPDDQCLDVANTPHGYVSMTVNGQAFTASSGIDAGNVSAACGTPGNNQNTIVFTYGH
ncbi:type 4 pilus major pilin [Paraburkholderia largidicola]|uniref:Type 4 secretion system PilS N-terminal domain-containing protein n=1 Tax=Paraburkholderia largidicola TaxID=3014751 RepID=A0A7I8C4P2_9BURK|nr:type 4 pilus major pilin [Paraburkholderia sp. PGU16]BCF95431.1 hypothetical protein PPGU16_84980 [Paraburkholderia sp. PGU16]